MNRRGTVLALIALSAAPLASFAQQSGKVWHVGWLSLSWANRYKELYDAFRTGLREHGYVEGQNVVIEPRWAEGRRERLRTFAAELARLKVDVMVVSGTLVVAAAKEVTNTIPIVMVSAADPVGNRFAASLARPGGNITGQANMNTDTAPKLFELALQIAPKASRVAVLMSDDPTHPAQLNDVRNANKVTKLTVVPVKATSPREIEEAFAAMAKEKIDILIVLPGIDFNIQSKRIVELAAAQKLPTVCPRIEYVSRGGLISYGPSLRDMYRSAANYVDKILKGAKPADLPIEQPTKFELVINRKTAKALGITIPPSLLLRADQVIE